MNYYEHHIRDYDAATSHLSWEEDLAYTRLIRWYYRKELPIPADIKEACRQVRATSKVQRDAVESVLKEFFDLKEDGWHKDTCDEVIKRFQDGEPEREIKKVNEENRTKRHREERSKLFKIITDAGQHASWNIPIADLRVMAARITATGIDTNKNVSSTEPVTAPATPVTATQSPITNHQSPELKTSPIPPKGEKPDRKKTAVALKTYIKDCKTISIKPIPDEDAVFDYAHKAGIPDDFLWLQWKEFIDRYCAPDAKRYKDWKAVFRKTVRGNWFKLWYIDGNGQYALTTVGVQAQNTHKGKAA